MNDHVSHCPDCRTEFVAGIEACSDCGGPVRPGELPPRSELRRSAERDDAMRVGDTEITVEPPDTLLTEVVGEKAEMIAKALTVEGIPSLLACDGIEQLRGPHEPPRPPLARKRMVEIYVPHVRLDDAREIAASMMDDDLIGDQWQQIGQHEFDDADRDDVISPEEAIDEAAEAHDIIASGPIAPQPEGGRSPLLVFALVTAVVVIFLYLL